MHDRHIVPNWKKYLNKTIIYTHADEEIPSGADDSVQTIFLDVYRMSDNGVFACIENKWRRLTEVNILDTITTSDADDDDSTLSLAIHDLIKQGVHDAVFAIGMSEDDDDQVVFMGKCSPLITDRYVLGAARDAAIRLLKSKKPMIEVANDGDDD